MSLFSAVGRVAVFTGIATGLAAKVLTDISFGRAFAIGSLSVLAECLALYVAFIGEDAQKKNSESNAWWYKALVTVPIALISVPYLAGVSRKDGITELMTVATLATIVQVFFESRTNNPAN